MVQSYWERIRPALWKSVQMIGTIEVQEKEMLKIIEIIRMKDEIELSNRKPQENKNGKK